MVVRKEGGLFSQDTEVMVNYRLQHDRYIVDAVFDKAYLIAGVGSDQSRVTITKTQGNKNVPVINACFDIHSDWLCNNTIWQFCGA